MSVRLRLRRADGEVYLDRWGAEIKPLGGIFLHRMNAPDPGLDIHDHPWWFASFVLKGGYIEERNDTRTASQRADRAVAQHATHRGRRSIRRQWTWRTMRMDEAHRITHLLGKHSWSLIIHGPWRREWGFYLPSQWMDSKTYDCTIRPGRRDLYADISTLTKRKGEKEIS